MMSRKALLQGVSIASVVALLASAPLPAFASSADGQLPKADDLLPKKDQITPYPEVLDNHVQNQIASHQARLVSVRAQQADTLAKQLAEKGIVPNTQAADPIEFEHRIKTLNWVRTLEETHRDFLEHNAHLGSEAAKRELHVAHTRIFLLDQELRNLRKFAPRVLGRTALAVGAISMIGKTNAAISAMNPSASPLLSPQVSNKSNRGSGSVQAEASAAPASKSSAGMGR